MFLVGGHQTSTPTPPQASWTPTGHPPPQCSSDPPLHRRCLTPSPGVLAVYPLLESLQWFESAMMRVEEALGTGTLTQATNTQALGTSPSPSQRQSPPHPALFPQRSVPALGARSFPGIWGRRKVLGEPSLWHGRAGREPAWSLHPSWARHPLPPNSPQQPPFAHPTSSSPT